MIIFGPLIRQQRLLLALSTMVLTRSGAGCSGAVGVAAFTTVPAVSSAKGRITAVASKARMSSSAVDSDNDIQQSKKKIRRLSKKNEVKRTSKKKNAEGSEASGNKDEKGKNNSNSKENLLISLPDDVVVGELICRPSKRNRSPYVADVLLAEENREVIAHVPNLDMGGKCTPGAKLLMKPARDKKGNLVGPNAVNPKYNTPKCEYIAQLLRVDESSFGPYEKTWVRAHPSLGEKIAEQLLERNLLGPSFPEVANLKREVRNIGGADMRADFVFEHNDPTLAPQHVVEVKTVVDTDYAINAVPSHDKLKCVFTSDIVPYQRTAIFPWGQSNQKGPEGEKVVSARAIKHVRELTRLKSSNKYDATVLFIVIRGDATVFRPNHEACPSFAKYLKEAEQAGVRILAKQVYWGDTSPEDIGKCYEGKLLNIEWPDLS